MLSRRWLINFGLLALIILFTFIGNKYQVQQGYQPGNRILKLDAANIDSIVVKTADESLRFRRNAGSWQIESPIQWPANNINLERLLTITRSETDSRLPAGEIDLSSIGLQFPRALLQLNDTSIAFGATNQIGERRYILIDSTVYLLTDSHYPFIAQGLLGLIDRRLLPASLGLQALKLPGLELTRLPDESWQASGTSSFSQEQLQQLVGNWQGLQASRVKTYSTTNSAQQKILVRLGDGSSLEFFLLSISPEIIIANPTIGLQYHFDKSYYYQLISLREKDNDA